MVEQMQGVITETLVSIILALIALAGSYAVYYIKKATDKLKLETEKIENEEFEKLINTALQRLSDVTTLTVNKIEQKTAKAIRESVKEGKLDKSELELLSMEAYFEIKKILEPEYLELIENTLGDAQTYITNLVEDKLVEIKNRDQVLEL
jgi:histidinol dehydrogenase